MKNVVIILLFLFVAQVSRAENTVVTLNFKNTSLSSQENQAAVVDLQQEIRRQSSGTNLNGLRLSQVQVIGSSAVLGATVALVIADEALDSQTIESAVSQTVSLQSDVGNTQGSWLLGIRGQLNLEKVVLTLDSSSGPDLVRQPEPIPLPVVTDTDVTPELIVTAPSIVTAPPATVTVPPAEPIENDLLSMFGPLDRVYYQPSQGEDYFRGKYNGHKDAKTVIVISAEGDNLSVPLNKMFKRLGCLGDVCVGQRLHFRGVRLTVVGINRAGVLIRYDLTERFNEIDWSLFMENSGMILPETAPRPKPRPDPAAPAPKADAPAKVKKPEPTVVAPAPKKKKNSEQPKVHNDRANARRGAYAEFGYDGLCYERRSGTGQTLAKLSLDACRKSQGTYTEFGFNGVCYEKASGTGVTIQQATLNRCRKSQGTYAEFGLDGVCYEKASGTGVKIQRLQLNNCRKSQGTYAERGLNGICYEKASGTGIAIQQLKSHRCR